MPGIWIDQVNERKPPKIIVLDIDSSVSPTYGDQEGTAYNGHFGCTCYHPVNAGCQRRSKSTPLAGVKMHHLMRFSPALAVVPVVHRRDPRCFV